MNGERETSGTGLCPRRLPSVRCGHRGVSALEMLMVVMLVGTLALYGAPSFVRWRQQQEVEAAVRHLGLLVTRVCAAAVASGRAHAVQFDVDGADMRWVTVVDGDGDGVTNADLAAHVDVPLGAWSSLRTLFPATEGGRPPGVPTVLGGAVGRDGLAFGRSKVVSCAPTGGVRPGTLYLRSRSGDAAALRIYGPTGRIALWWWSGPLGDWVVLR